MNIEFGKVQSTDVLIYEFGARLDRECHEAAFEQIKKSRALYNDLIAAIQSIVKRLQDFTMEAAGPEAKRLQVCIDGLSEDFKAAKAEDDEEKMKPIALQRRGLWKELAVILKATRQQHKQHIQKEFLSRIGRNTECDTYKIRCESVRNGLGWATANAVLEAACIAFKKTFITGRAPRFCIGEEKMQDVLTLQFVEAGGVSMEDIFSVDNSEFYLLPDGCGKRRYGEFRFRLGAAREGKYATGTFQYHRPIPEGSHIGIARLIRRKIGKDYKWAIQLMVKPPEPIRVPTADRKPLAAVHFGWSDDVLGRRVAAIAIGSSAVVDIRLPREIEEGLQLASKIQGERDDARDILVSKLHWIKDEQLPDDLTEELAAIKKLPSQYVSISRLHRLCNGMKKCGYEEPFFDQWRKDDRMRWQSATHIARRSRNRRRTYYCEVASELARKYQAVAIEPLSLAEAALKVDEKTGEKSDFAKRARAGRVVAAIYELESAIRWACAKTNAAVFDVVGKTVSECSSCGGPMNADEENHQIITCSSCFESFDRKYHGAITAWRALSNQVENRITEYHFHAAEEMRKKSELKSQKREKITAGRKLRIAEKNSERSNDESPSL